MSRLLNIGVAPYLLADTIRGVLSQRLVLRTCQGCFGAGCEACNDTEYRGLCEVSELLRARKGLAKAIHNESSLSAIMEKEKKNFGAFSKRPGKHITKERKKCEILKLPSDLEEKFLFHRIFKSTSECQDWKISQLSMIVKIPW